MVPVQQLDGINWRETRWNQHLGQVSILNVSHIIHSCLLHTSCIPNIAQGNFYAPTCCGYPL